MLIRLATLVLGLLATSSAAFAQSPNAAAPERVCRSVIGMEMGRDPKTISASRSGDSVFLQYRRPQDGSMFRYECRVEGSSVVWAAIINGTRGRWRDEREDTASTFRVEGRNLVVEQRFSDGSSARRVFGPGAL